MNAVMHREFVGEPGGNVRNVGEARVLQYNRPYSSSHTHPRFHDYGPVRPNVQNSSPMGISDRDVERFNDYSGENYWRGRWELSRGWFLFPYAHDMSSTGFGGRDSRRRTASWRGSSAHPRDVSHGLTVEATGGIDKCPSLTFFKSLLRPQDSRSGFKRSIFPLSSLRVSRESSKSQRSDPEPRSSRSTSTCPMVQVPRIGQSRWHAYHQEANTLLRMLLQGAKFRKPEKVTIQQPPRFCRHPGSFKCVADATTKHELLAQFSIFDAHRNPVGGVA